MHGERLSINRAAVADQTFKIGVAYGDFIQLLIVEANEVSFSGEKEDRVWKIVGRNGTVLVSALAFQFAYPIAMEPANSE
ncbi:MAG: hypothetical protein JO334_05430 [Verrucomicrobia bacterium]|nr:hypothetical protein [Verrucomicrobiota bacterium]